MKWKLVAFVTGHMPVMERGENMTREEVLKVLKEMAFTATETQRRALEDAISTLSENKGEPCDDCISRKDAIQALKAGGLEELCRSLGVYPWNVIKMIPSVQPVPCEDCISRNDVIKMLNTMDRYTADKLKLCDTDKEFPHNEVFIVDDVYEGLDLLPSVQPVIPNTTITVDDSYMRNVRRDCGLYE